MNATPEYQTHAQEEFAQNTFMESAAISSLHFLPPRELHAVRRQMGLLQALHLLQDFLSQLDAHGIGLL